MKQQTFFYTVLKLALPLVATAAVYDFTGRFVKSVAVHEGGTTAISVAPGYYIVRLGSQAQSVIVK